MPCLLLLRTAFAARSCGVIGMNDITVGLHSNTQGSNASQCEPLLPWALLVGSLFWGLLEHLW